MQNEISVINEENIKDKIYIIRGKEVMLDSDLGELYNVETKRINEAVKNNPMKFPERYSWKLSDSESKNFLVENFDQKKETRGGKYKNPRVFTEQGVAMLATIIKSKEAAQVSINIMDAFVAMRHVLINSINYQKELFIMQNRITNIDNKLIEYDSKFNEIFDSFGDKLNHIYYEGETYDAYSFILDLFNKSKKELIIIDNYVDKKTLDLISKLKTKVIIVSKNMNEELIKKYQEQYNNLTIIQNDSFHDRFIIIDRKELYTSGSSIKDVGKKCFSINKIQYDNMLKDILNVIWGK